MADARDIRRFDGPDEFRARLREQPASSPGVWLTLAKKGARVSTGSYAEAPGVALRYGWIDGQAQGIDEESYLQRFSPRRPQSPWSLRNPTRAEERIEAAEMAPSGLAAVEQARATGRWDKAYEGQRTADQYPDFLEARARNASASAIYAALDSQNRYAIYYRIQHAKRAETRARRIENFVDMLARGEKFH